MPSHSSAFVNWSQYVALRTVAGIVPCFDVRQNLTTAASIGSLYFRLGRRRRERALENLQRSFPEWSSREVRRVARRSVEHMLQLLMVDALVMSRLITPASWPRHIHVGNLGPILDCLMGQRPIILLTGHYGNWELLGYWLAVIGCPTAVVARPIDNPLVDRWLLEVREARGTRIITKWGASDVLQAELEAGGRVAFIADQNAGDQGLFVPFFGRLASSYKSIALLALRYEVPVAVAGARRIADRFEYEMEIADFIHPDDWADQPDPVFYITARYNHALERMIRGMPEQYLWVHRRWRSRPRFERQGRPMPGRLIEKIESLPWMTPHELDRIINASAA